MTRHRRHPAQASRILATGLSTATLLGIVAVLGAQPGADPPDGHAGVAPPRATVVLGAPDPSAAGRQATTRQGRQAATTTTRPS